MSYILDALKKADQKRKLGTVPDVHTVHEAPGAESRRPVWVYGVAAILFVNAGLIGWWLWSGGSHKAPTPKPPVKSAAARPEKKAPPTSPPRPAKVTPPPVASVPPPAPPASQAPAVQSPVTPPAAQAVAPAATVPVSQPPAAQVSVAKMPAVQPVKAGPAGQKMPVSPSATPPAPVAASTPLVPMVAPAKPKVPVVEEPAAAEEPAVEESVEESIAAAEEDEGGGASVAAEEEGEAAGEGEVLVPIATSPAKDKAKKRKADKESEEDPELAKIPFLKQLPDEVQQGIPELHISFHSYSIKPASRLVSISGKILREGEKFDESLKLETITQKGVVLEANGRRFRLEVQ